MQEIGKYENQTIAVRGFLLKDGNGWILSDESQLKSCCIGKKKNQLRVSGEVDGSVSLATVQGMLVIERENPLPYHLVNASSVSSHSGYALPLPLALSLAALGFLIFKHTLRR